MNKFLAATTVIVLAASAATAPAQTQEPNYRAEFPKGDAAWSVVFTKEKKPDEASQKAPSLKSMEIVRQGDLRRDTVIWTDGEKSEHWWSTAGNEVFFENRGDTVVRTMKASQRSDARYDETFFSWVGRKTFVDERTLDGRKYWYFEAKSRSDTNDENETLAAWVNPETARPVAWSDSTRVVYFEFKTLEPGFKLIPPAQFMEVIARYNAYRTPPTRVKRRE